MNKSILRGALTMMAAATLAACNQQAQYDSAQQAGGNPPLPAARNFFAPPMQVPKYVGWQNDATPKVADGLKIEKIATGLEHPRQVYALPNGDILVAESNSPGEEAVTTPKQLIAGLVESRSGKKAKGANRITLLRKRADGSGTWDKTVFIDNLHSPFGMQLIGDTLYVADTDAILKFPYKAGDTHIAGPGVELTDLPDTVNHHWTKALLASPDGKKLFVGVGSNSNVGENGLEVEYRRANVLEVDVATGGTRIYAAGIRNPTGLQWEPKTGQLWTVANERDEIGADLVPDYLAAPRSGREGDQAGLRDRLARRTARLAVLHGQQPAGAVSRRRVYWRAWQLGSLAVVRLRGHVCRVRERQAGRRAEAGGHRLRHRRREGAARRAGRPRAGSRRRAGDCRRRRQCRLARDEGGWLAGS
jgi:glucose/arabinose dehydrogenase